MKIEPSNDPNKTVKYGGPSSYLGWWDDYSLRPTCEPYDLSVGSQFFTTNKGFLYTVDKVYVANNETKDPGTMVQSVSYLNNPLENCRPTYIILGLTKDDTVVPPTWWISWVGQSYFEAKASCTIETQDGRATIDISMKKSGVAVDLWDYVVAPYSSASFWWGARLLNTYWFGFLQVLSRKGHFEEKGAGFYNRGRFTFAYNPDDEEKKNKTIHNVDFHGLGFFLVSSSKAYSVGRDAWEAETQLSRSLAEVYNNPQFDMSLAITEASYFAKVVHSFLVADLANPKIPNMLLEEADLRSFLSGKENNTNRQKNGELSNDPGPDGRSAFLYRLKPPGNYTSNKRVLLNESFDAFKSHLGGLGTTSSTTIHKQYLCSVPRKKSPGRIILLVLVADLVFLQVTWKLLNLGAEALVEQQAPTTAMVCEGCIEEKGKDRETPTETQSLMSENEDGQHR